MNLATDRNKYMVMAVLLIAFLSYSFLLYSAGPASGKRVPGEVMAGKMVWQKYNCNACHQLYGLGGYLGPDLTNVYSRKGQGYIRAFLFNGTATMPKFNFTETETANLLAFLQNTDASGDADPRHFKINPDGTISNQ